MNKIITVAIKQFVGDNVGISLIWKIWLPEKVRMHMREREREIL